MMLIGWVSGYILTQHIGNERVKGIEGSTERNSIGLAAKFKEFLGDVKELSARTASYDDVVKAAKEISASCVKDWSFRDIFNNDDESIRAELVDIMRVNEKTSRDRREPGEALRPWSLQNENDPFFTIVFD